MRRVKILGDSADMEIMFSTITTRLKELTRWLATPPPGPTQPEAADWFAGLSVDAESFTRDLCELREALGVAPAINSGKPARPVVR